MSYATGVRRGLGAGLMEPRIQYVKTSDGVSIAYWTDERPKRRKRRKQERTETND